MRQIMSLVLLLVVGIEISIASAQGSDPTEARIHSVMGVITKVSRSSFTLRAGNAERQLSVDRTTRVLGIGTMVNDGVLRTPRPLPFKPGDQVLVTYRDDDGVLRALEVRIAPRKSNAK